MLFVQEIRQAGIQRINQQLDEFAGAKDLRLRDRVWDDGLQDKRESHIITIWTANCNAEVTIPEIWLLDYLSFETFAVLRLRAAIDELVACEDAARRHK